VRFDLRRPTFCSIHLVCFPVLESSWGGVVAGYFNNMFRQQQKQEGVRFGCGYQIHVRVCPQSLIHGLICFVKIR
jgi:hypothetical protein